MFLVPLTAACIATAAGVYEIPQTYLYAILAIEGGRVGQAVADKNRTSDLGPFQINSRWGPALGRFWSLPTAEALDRVRNDGCANAIAASAILKGELAEARGDMIVAVGLYHSHSAGLSETYRQRVLSMAKRFS